MHSTESTEAGLTHGRQSRSQGSKPHRVGTWLPDEDARLREAVTKHGTRWVAVANDVRTRHGDQCAKRWNEKLNPDLDHSRWKAVEDHALLNMVQQYGHNWKYMAETVFEGRAPLSIKNRYSLLMRRSRRQEDVPSAHRPTGQTATASIPHGRAVSGAPAPSFEQSDNLGKGNRTFESINPATMSGSSINVPPHVPHIKHGTARSPPYANNHQFMIPDYLNTSDMSLDGMDIDWQQLAYSSGGIDLGNVMSHDCIETQHLDINNVGSDLATNSLPDSEAESTPMPLKTFSVLPSDTSNMATSSSSNVEYVISCQRNELKMLVDRLIDETLSSDGPQDTGTDHVSLTLRLST